MIASLPMYDRPETKAANDRFWALIRDNLYFDKREMPRALTRRDDPWNDWRDPSLVLSQTCSLPYRRHLYPDVTLVGTPVHDLSCAPGYYYSVVVARASDERQAFGDFDGARLAINDALSQSGWAAPWSFAKDHGIAFGAVLTSGSHRESAAAVAAGQADVAALDAVTWRLVQRFDGFAASLKQIATTPPTPALPYIAAPGHDTSDLYNAISAAIDQLNDDDRDLLCLKGITAHHPDRYLELQSPPPPG